MEGLKSQFTCNVRQYYKVKNSKIDKKQVIKKIEMPFLPLLEVCQDPFQGYMSTFWSRQGRS